MKKEINEFVIKDLRLINGKKQSEMGQLLGITEAGYRKKESGTTKLYFSEVKILMKTFDLSFEEIDKIIENTINTKNKS